MEFRPCIDIHNGKVKQIVGATLRDDDKESLQSNFISDRGADSYAALYRDHGLKGGHIALLNKRGTMEYEDDIREAGKALKAYRGGMQIGGGITDESALRFIEDGASHVIVTSYIFTKKELDMKKLSRLRASVGKEHVVIDLSCRRKDESYYVVTDRWQTFTDAKVTEDLFSVLSDYCDEFLIHAADIEGKRAGIDENIVALLGRLPYVSTYAGGIASLSDILKIKELGSSRVNFTVGSALDIFGGSLKLPEVIACTQ
ncbi:MAG: phosphoribosylformimino-5-aminoimidazole carboxamide ribotide isomerase [Lachnospiraceae bacterium]|nr:phosphoribosylformimino-5-aminoimidazole carboxamide ribotide isomerase [Lachnospiraceae bacterium]